ncbi:MAG: hypothetical protein K1X39_00320 [Thermoflexales bacterium]|nr:hypothetical protein [Thermoflexales bacterium]
MRISADEQKIKKYSAIARAIIIGSLVVIGGLFIATLPGSNFLSNNPDLFSVMYFGSLGLMLLVFLISRIGMVWANRYASPVRPEKMLRESLKGLDRRYALMLFRKPIDYYLVDAGGITALICKGQRGRISFENGKWKRRGSGLSGVLASEEPLGDPYDEATKSMATLQQTLAEKAPGLSVPINAVVVFTHPETTLQVEPGPIPVVRVADLKDYLRGAGKRRDLPASIQRAVRAALDAPELPAAEPG